MNAIGRNDLCPCVSGKKYKKCCEPKKEMQTRTIPHPNLYEMTFINEPITANDYDSLSENDQETVSQLCKRLHFHPKTIKSEDDEFFTTLKQLRKKYPNYPPLWNYTGRGYNILGLKDKLRKSILETYKRFPKYLFAMTGMANLYVIEGKHEKVFEIFGDKQYLTEVFPNRSEFHVTEGRVFHHAIALYYCKIDELEIAKAQLEVLEVLSKAVGIKNDPLIADIRREILKKQIIQGLRWLKSLLNSVPKLFY